MDAIKGIISSITGSSGQTEEYKKNDGPAPQETGLQSRGQTTETGKSTMFGEARNPVHTAPGEVQGSRDSGDAVANAKTESIEEFIRDRYKSTAGGGSDK